MTLDPGGLATRLPPGFLLGAATSAYQIEGAFDAGGKGQSIWDRFCRVPGAVRDGDTGEVACDHYHRFREDVALMAELGLDAYRFSVSWPRVLPAGTGAASTAGLDFYDRLVDALVERGIRPFVTLYHWDLPQALQERGGWGSREVAGWFGDYAALVAGRLGDRVADWITLNEPEVVAFAGHAHGRHAPGLRDWPLALRAAHHLLLAHRAAAEALWASSRDCSVGIALDINPYRAASGSPADAEAARRLDDHLHGWFLDPLFGRGYPQAMVDWYGDLLPAALPEELSSYDGALDFLGVNYYTAQLARAGGEGPLRAERAALPARAGGYPEELRALLVRVAEEYGPPRIYVTENGLGLAGESPAPDGHVEDGGRVRYLAGHLEAAAEAIVRDAPVLGYFVWSLLDNFEWAQGFGQRFGLVRVDYPTQRRTLKASARWYQEVTRAR